MLLTPDFPVEVLSCHIHCWYSIQMYPSSASHPDSCVSPSEAASHLTSWHSWAVEAGSKAPVHNLRDPIQAGCSQKHSSGFGTLHIFIQHSRTASSIVVQASTPAVQKVHQHQSAMSCCCPAPPNSSFWAGTTFLPEHLSTWTRANPRKWHPSHRNPWAFMGLPRSARHCGPDSVHPEQLAGRREIPVCENLSSLLSTLSALTVS